VHVFIFGLCVYDVQKQANQMAFAKRLIESYVLFVWHWLFANRTQGMVDQIKSTHA